MFMMRSTQNDRTLLTDNFLIYLFLSAMLCVQSTDSCFSFIVRCLDPFYLIISIFQTDLPSAVCRFQVLTCRAVSFRQITSFKVIHQCFTNTNKIFQKKPLLSIFTKAFAFLDISKITITAQKFSKITQPLYLRKKCSLFCKTFLVICQQTDVDSLS